MLPFSVLLANVDLEVPNKHTGVYIRHKAHLPIAGEEMHSTSAFLSTIILSHVIHYGAFN